MAITQQQAQERAEAVAREYEQLSYEELLARYESLCKDPIALSAGRPAEPRRGAGRGARRSPEH